MTDDQLASLQRIQDVAIEHAVDEMDAAHALTLATKEERGDRAWLTGMAGKSLGVAVRIEQFIVLKERAASLGVKNSDADEDARQASFLKRAEAQLQSIMGPVIGLGESMFNLTQGNLVQAAQGKDTHAGAEIVRFAKSNIPGQNLWYTKAALDHMIFHQLQEHFSPGYLARIKSRSRKEFGQGYWWEPGDTTPDRAPDLAAAMGE